jgi:MFS family permease
MASENKLFGMKPEAGRWIFVILGMVIELCLGTVYAWSVFKGPVQKIFNIDAFGAGIPYVLFLFFFAALMPFGGRLINRIGPRKIGLIGGAIVGLGWILSAFSNGNIVLLDITYGLIAGAGVGLAYGGPMAVATKWFPDRKGLAVGLTVGGFGLSALITQPLALALIGGGSAGELSNTFLYLGIAFIIITMLLAIPLRFPAADWKPAGWAGPKAGTVVQDINTSGMLKTRSFYILWLCFFFGSLAGLLAIQIWKPVGLDSKLFDLKDAVNVFAVVFPVFNFAGRPGFGWLTDRITPRWSGVLSFIFLILASVLIMVSGPGATALYAVAFILFYLALGGWLAIAPTATTTYFGAKNYANNYGIMFLAYGIGAIAGNFLLLPFGTDYKAVFLPVLIMAGIGLVLALVWLKPPKRA